MRTNVIICIVLAALSLPAKGQVSFRHYLPDPNYLTLPLPLNAIMLARFDAVAPLRLDEVSAWLVSSSEGGAMDIVLYGHEGGYPFPYQMRQLLQPIRIVVPPHTDSLFRIVFREPIRFTRPTQFFVGVIKRSEGVQVRMDRALQDIPCSSPGADTMFTSIFAIRDGASERYRFGARGFAQRPINNWYIGAEGEYEQRAVPASFTDVTGEAGLANGEKGPRRMAWGDFDNDGYQDLLWGDHVFRNAGDGTFQDLSRAVGYYIGSEVNMFVDFDNDGDLDIVCQPKNFVYRNDEGRFTFVSDPGLGLSENTQAMAFADVNGDSYPDLFVANAESRYFRQHGRSKDSAMIEGLGSRSYLYMNQGGRRFADSTALLHGYTADTRVRHPSEPARMLEGYRTATCAQWIDFDDDGDPDLFIGTDHLQPN
jgi:hypothetical protein